METWSLCVCMCVCFFQCENHPARTDINTIKIHLFFGSFSSLIMLLFCLMFYCCCSLFIILCMSFFYNNIYCVMITRSFWIKVRQTARLLGLIFCILNVWKKIISMCRWQNHILVSWYIFFSLSVLLRFVISLTWNISISGFFFLRYSQAKPYKRVFGVLLVRSLKGEDKTKNKKYSKKRQTIAKSLHLMGYKLWYAYAVNSCCKLDNRRNALLLFCILYILWHANYPLLF